jgi:ABC-type hemin transport system ATPase subunit
MSGVEVRGLTKTFGRVTAVREMSFTAPAGKVTGFLGPNGSGKTTWIALIEGIAGQLAGSGPARWLPLRASEAVGRADLTGASRLLPQWGAGLVLAGYAIAFAVAAMVTTLRRDVT